MVRCFAIGCGNDARVQGSYFSFHRIPQGLVRQQQWLKLIGRDPVTFIHGRQVVCSYHFTEDQFKVGMNRKELVETAIPNINLPVPFEEANFQENIDEPVASTSADHDIFKSRRKREMKDVESRPITPKKIKFSMEEKDSSPAASLKSTSSTNSSPNQPKIKKKSKYFHYKSSSSTDSRKTPSSGTSSVKRRIIKKMHTYSRPSEYYKIELDNARKKIKHLKTKMDTTKRTNARRLRKINSLKQALSEVKKKFKLSSNALDHIESTFSGVPLDIMRRMMLNLRVQNKHKGAVTRTKYPHELKAFAMTLQFYSAKAYDYVRHTFNLALPSPSAIRKWLAKVDCSPGFTQPAIEALKIRSNDFYKQNGYQLLCSLMLDEMSIKKEIITERHSSNIWGYVDVGSNMDVNNDRDPASHVLVLMVVGVNANFKIPIGYFFINSMSGIERANLVKEALMQLSGIETMRILSLTCDGPHVHFKMMNELGCQVSSVENLKTSFLHPISGEKIYVIFDICHMLKLIRNNWASEGIILDKQNKEVNWKYIEKLNELQKEEGLYLGNKLREKHIKWTQAKMRVKIAAQTLSQSVADALKFLKDDIELTDFQDVGPTIEFIQNINNIFDFLNSRNPFGFGMNTPMREANESYWKPRVRELYDYIQNLKNKEGHFLHMTKKKVPIVGFLVSITSLLNLYEREVVERKSIKYILTYKFSQDHLELFFCGVRSRNSCNNPNCLQFMQTYRRMLTHINIKNNTGNCIGQDCTEMLHVTESSKERTEITNIRWERRKEEEMEEIEEKCRLLAPIQLNELQENVVSYICGFVVNSIKKKISCPICEEAIIADFDDMHGSLKLIKRKSRGKLLYPSVNVQIIGQKIEKTIKKIFNVLGYLPPKDIFIELIMKETRTLISNENIFSCLENHVFDQAPYEEMHKKILIEKIAKKYASIRLNSLGNKINETISGDKVRDQLKRLVLFRHQ